MKKRQTLDNRT